MPSPSDARALLGRLELGAVLLLLLAALVASLPRRGEDVEPAAPAGSDWPLSIRSDRAKLGLFRTRWRDEDDILAILHDGAIRILGRGTRWVSRQGLPMGLQILGNHFDEETLLRVAYNLEQATDHHKRRHDL